MHGFNHVFVMQRLQLRLFEQETRMRLMFKVVSCDNLIIYLILQRNDVFDVSQI